MSTKAERKLHAGNRRTRLTARPRERVVPNQVFIGCPWHNYRQKYDRITLGIHKSSPIVFVMVGRGDGQEAEDLLRLIRERLLSSSFAVFDSTGGNANVSLEYGMAQEAGVPSALYLHDHARAVRHAKDSPIIADLAGKRRNQYKQEKGLRRLLMDLVREHAYNRRFEGFMRKEFAGAGASNRRRWRALALKVVHALDGKSSVRRSDLLAELLVDWREPAVVRILAMLHKSGLIRITRGRYSTISLR